MNHLLLSYHTCPMEEPGEGLSGGMNVFLRGLLPGLAARGVRTDVLTRSKGAEVSVSAPWEGVRIVHVPCAFRDPPCRESAYEALPRFMESANKLLPGLGTAHDVASAHYWMSGVALRAIKPALPMVLVYHTVEARKALSAGSSPDSLSLVRRAAEKEMARVAGRVVSFTHEDLRETEDLFPEVRGKGVVIPPGVEERFRRPPPRRESRRRHGIPESVFLYLLAARPDPGKNVAAAVAAFGRVRAEAAVETMLLVAGQGAPRGGTPDGVRFAGPVPHDEMPWLYAAADVAICPSLYESFGLVPLEATAAGLPIVVPADGFWGRRVRESGGGVVYSTGSASGLADAMLAAARDGAFRERHSEAAARSAAPFTWETCTESWERLLSGVAMRGSPR